MAVNSVHSFEQASTLTVSPEQAAELLLELEDGAFEGRVSIDSELGVGEVLLHGGSITQAQVGTESGRVALQQLLTVSQGTWTIHACPVADTAPIVSCVDALTVRDDSRQKHWDALCSRAPAMSSVLRLSTAGAFVRETTNGYGSSLLSLVDGQRTLSQLLEESDCEPVETMQLLLKGIEQGLIQQATTTNSLFPLAATEESSGFMPRSSSSARPLEAGDAEEAVQQGDVPVASERGRSPSEQLAVAISQPHPTRVRHFIGRYEILMRIGRGGMGTVYLSRLNSEETGFRRLVALKLLRSHLSSNSQAAREFIDEARIAGVVHHANVVGVTDAGFHGQQPYLVMDYVEGCGLRQLMSGWVCRSPHFLLPIVLDALSGLHAVHTLRDDAGRELRLVHCDVSPENMLVGVDGMCRITDFGIVRQANRINGAAARGKLGYIAPEQIEGQAFDHRSDIFAIGVVLWNALTGQNLFSGRTVEEAMANSYGLEIPTPTSLGAESTPELDRIILRALSRDPEQRFRSAEDMAMELRDAALRGPGLATTRDVASWVREVAGHQLALRRLAILDASRSTTAVSRESPSTHLRLLPRSDLEQSVPFATPRATPTQEPPTALVLSSGDVYESEVCAEASAVPPSVDDADNDCPRDPTVSALFYGIETLTDQTHGTSASPAANEADTNRRHPPQRFTSLTQRCLLIGIAVLLGGLASYLWTSATSPQPTPQPQSRVIPGR